jgi:hypothetical protein
MKFRTRLTVIAFALIALGCASSKVSELETYQGNSLARPDRIIVHDFAMSAAQLPGWSEARDAVAEPSKPPTAEEMEVGRKLGSLVAEELVAEIREMGLPGVRSAGQPVAKSGDIALVGWFESIDEGSRLKRVAIGFGSGAAELTTRVEGYVATDSGMRPLGSGKVDSGGPKGPGAIVPIAVTAATANPIGLAANVAVKAHGELTGRMTIEGTAKRTADAVADELRKEFQKQGWIR